MQQLDISRKYPIVNGLLVVLGCTACVFLANNWALFVAMTLLIIHFRFSLSGEWRFIIQVTVIGWMFNSILFRTHVLGIGQDFPPAWLTSVWLIFAISICHSLRVLTRYLAYTPIIGSIFGAIVYFLIAAISSIGYIQPLWMFVLILMCSWALLLPLITFIAMSRVLSVSV